MSKPGLPQYLGWLVIAGLSIFLLASLIGFDPADWPSHAASPHNEPTANWCGPVGAAIAYYAYHVLGPGVWGLVSLIGAFLVATAFGAPVSHPFVRFFGALLVALALSALLALWMPALGPFPEGAGGLLAISGTNLLFERFSTFGTTLILVLVASLGFVVALDELAIKMPIACVRFLLRVRHVPAGRVSAGLVSVVRQSTEQVLERHRERAHARAEARAAAAEPWDDEEEQPSSSSSGRKRKRRGQSAREEAETIDPDAGGLGAVQAFDPEEVDEEEYEEAEAAELEPVPSTSPRKRTIDMDALREKISKLPVNFSAKRPVSAGAVDGKATARLTEDDLPRSEDYEGYAFPGFDLLEEPEHSFSERMEEFVREQASILESALQTYNIDGEVVGIDSGPVITLYEVQLAPGTKVSSIQTISSDIARSLRAQNIRIVPNMAGKTTVGIEVPNLNKERVRIQELMSVASEAQQMRLPMFLGKDASGTPLVSDLTSMPHMLIAGTTGSGKSVCMNTIIMSFLFTKRPDELKLILVDPKMVEMSQFRDIPHLMCPVVTEMSKAAAILEWAVTKMEERYELLAEVGVRDIANFNEMDWEEKKERLGDLSEEEEAKFPKKLPYIVFMIDELADLIMTTREVENSIVRIAQKARAVGIHLILATQRPQANVVTGLIKSNMPCRVSFKVSSGMDSRIVLDHKGAELLLGQGDMLYLSPRSSELIRAQGTLVDDIEIRRVVRFLKDVASPSFERQLMQLRSPASAEPLTEEERQGERERDPLFVEAVRIVVETGRGSVSLLQRRLAIGYTRASRLIDQMGQAGIIGEHKGSVAREVLITLDEWEHMRRMMEDEEAEGTLFDGDAAHPQSASTGDSETPAAVVEEEPPFETDDVEPEDDTDPEAVAAGDDDHGDEADDDDELEEEADETEYEYVDEDGNPIPADQMAEYEFDDDGDEEEEDEDGEYEYVYEDEDESVTP